MEAGLTIAAAVKGGPVDEARVGSRGGEVNFLGAGGGWLVAAVFLGLQLLYSTTMKKKGSLFKMLLAGTRACHPVTLKRGEVVSDEVATRLGQC